MRDLGPFAYLLLFAAFALLNYVMQRLAKRRNEQSSTDEGTGPEVDDVAQRAEELRQQRTQAVRRRLEQIQQRSRLPQQPEEPTSRVPLVAEQVVRLPTRAEEPEEVLRARARAARPERLPVLAIDTSMRSALRVLLADRRNLRQAIVLMTVLGPCRAQQPLDDRTSGGA
jgi:hypothetical protein